MNLQWHWVFFGQLLDYQRPIVNELLANVNRFAVYGRCFLLILPG